MSKKKGRPKKDFAREYQYRVRLSLGDIYTLKPLSKRIHIPMNLNRALAQRSLSKEYLLVSRITFRLVSLIRQSSAMILKTILMVIRFMLYTVA